MCVCVSVCVISSKSPWSPVRCDFCPFPISDMERKRGGVSWCSVVERERERQTDRERLLCSALLLLPSAAAAATVLYSLH